MDNPHAISTGVDGEPSQPSAPSDPAGRPQLGSEPDPPPPARAVANEHPAAVPAPDKAQGAPQPPPPPPSQPQPPSTSVSSDSQESGQPSPLHDYLAFFRGRIVVAAVVLLLGIFSLLTALVLGAALQPTPWDIVATREIQEIPSAPVGILLVGVSQPGFAPWNWIIVIALMAFFLAAFRRPVESLFVGLAGAGGALAEIVKNLVDRPRPTPDFAHILGTLKSYSFPSGHTTSYTILYGFLFYLVYAHLPRRSPVRTILLVFLALLVVLVGPSRVYMGQHWTSDVLAGYTLGLAYLLLLIELYRFWLKRNAKRSAGEGPPTMDESVKREA